MARLAQARLLHDLETYYAKANRARLPLIPDLTDMSGGLSNPCYWNFLIYCLWKVVSRYVISPEARTEFCSQAGADLLSRVWPEAGERCAAAKADGPASQAAVLQLVSELMGILNTGRYMSAWQLTWGEQPGSWPPDWFTASPGIVVGDAMDSGSADPAQPGMVFQLRLHQPADLAGSVAIRSEDEGFWPRAVSSMLKHLLADAGYTAATVDEYFFQDIWEGPTSLSDRLLLLFGDPLERVEVPFNPSTLVQNWELRL
ncbi:MAG: hypothetical protein WDW36_008078 [Sanguina aurantia]